MPLAFPPRPEPVPPKASGAPVTPPPKPSPISPPPAAVTPQQPTLAFPRPSAPPVMITPPQRPSLTFPRPAAPMSRQMPSPASVRHSAARPLSLLFSQSPVFAPPQRGTLTLPPPPGSVLPVPPGLTLPPLPQGTAEASLATLPTPPASSPPTSSLVAEGSTGRKRRASEQEAEGSEPETEPSGHKRKKVDRRPRRNENVWVTSGRKSFEYSEQELAERAARKRLRTRWQTGCSETDRARALNVALGKIGGGRQYSWLNQTPATPAQTTGVARTREPNIHADVIARELGISPEEVVDLSLPSPSPPVRSAPKAKPRPPPRPISGLKGPASASHFVTKWQRGGERLGHVAAAANAGGTAVNAGGAAATNGDATDAGAVTNTGDAVDPGNNGRAGDDGEEKYNDNDLIS
ncbi:hypothetical protein DL766_006268 [Monosporascus sp. MC13-8B]|uniref:Uncharacterized protein n=1 Tax=Monosporascus cannonballus TaxID=155416 RepID=A0ABY0HA16_9PEZI|nr:hypothetical protein DL762_003857 [Monosporascus cannonballus]RYO92850.1 hypothetical protein DL763_004575 [Monosporascus cannonballus]RYP27673.1 hypothetical protein DL766_006268 [Monosporascus sp. MC13-8B]